MILLLFACINATIDVPYENSSTETADTDLIIDSGFEPDLRVCWLEEEAWLNS